MANTPYKSKLFSQKKKLCKNNWYQIIATISSFKLLQQFFLMQQDIKTSIVTKYYKLLQLIFVEN